MFVVGLGWKVVSKLEVPIETVEKVIGPCPVEHLL